MRLMLKNLSTNKILPTLLITAIYLSTRLFGLGSDILNSDGARWYRRGEDFMQAIKTGDLISTYQHYQPGVTLMWINFVTRKVVWEVQDLLKIPRWSLENSQDFPKIHAVSKGLLVLVLWALLIYQMLIISKIINLKVALLYGFFVSTEPYLLGIDRWFHLTSLESYLAFSAFLTSLYSLVRWDKLSVVVTGILVALSTLSKLTGVVALLPILLMASIRAHSSKNYKRLFIFAGLVVASFSFTVFILFPALWVGPLTVMHKLFSATVSAMDNDARAQYFKPPLSYVYYLIILGFKLSPVILFAFLASLVVFVPQLGQDKTAQGGPVLAYFLTFFLVLTMSAKKIDRYCLTLIPPLVLFSSIYISKLKGKALVTVIVLQVFVSGFIYFCNFPVLSGFYSPIFGGARTALNLGVYENSGEYFAQAAFYLNNKRKANVYVPDNYEPFKYFYRGNTAAYFYPSAEYVVTSVDLDRKTPRIVDGCQKLEKTLGPKFEMPYVYIFFCDDLNRANGKMML